MTAVTIAVALQSNTITPQLMTSVTSQLPSGREIAAAGVTAKHLLTVQERLPRPDWRQDCAGCRDTDDFLAWVRTVREELVKLGMS
jgi:hypothetical protein